jgi:hypothetical protein
LILLKEKLYPLVLGLTVTVADCAVLPDVPRHESVYALELVGDSDAVPESVFAPDHAPDAVQDVAFVDDHVSVTDWPVVTVVGFAESETVGGGAGSLTVGDGAGLLTVITTLSLDVSSVSPAVRPKVYVPAVENVTDVLVLAAFARETGAGPLSKLHFTAGVLPVGNPSSLTVPVTFVPTVPVDKMRI